MMINAKKVGIMGGTFDPIHYGHLLIAQTALEQFELDRILFIPAGNPPHKAQITDASVRYKMVEIAIEDNENFLISDIEVMRKSYSYTYETLTQLKESNPDTEYYFIMGADSLFDFDQWVEPQIIAKLAKIVVAVRDQINIEQIHTKIQNLEKLFNADIKILSSPNFSISSHEIRNCIMQQGSARYQTPDRVLSYINEHNLYS